MEQTKYDVFISYSRKDYVDEQKNAIPGNVITAIKEVLHQKDISYWMDEEGNLTGKKFAHIIAGKIRESMVFLFVCSRNSVESRWVDRELSVADTLDKHIIPFICDDSYMDDKVIMFTSSLDRVDYFRNPQKELEKLIKTIEKDKKELKRKMQEEEEFLQQKQREEEERERQRKAEEERKKKQQEEEAKKEKIKKEINELVSDGILVRERQEEIFKQFVRKNKILGKIDKVCPVCETTVSIESPYCTRCGWQFPSTYSLYGEESLECDKKQLFVAKTIWTGSLKVSELNLLNKKLENEKSALQESFEQLLNECKQHLNTIETKDKTEKALKDEVLKKDEMIRLLETKMDEAEGKIERTILELNNKTRTAEKEIKQQKQLIGNLQKALSSEKENSKRVYKDKDSLKKENTELEGKLIAVLNQLAKIEQDNNSLREIIEQNDAFMKKLTQIKPITSIEFTETINICKKTKSHIWESDLIKKSINIYDFVRIIRMYYGIDISEKQIDECKTIGKLKTLVIQLSKDKQKVSDFIHSQ